MDHLRETRMIISLISFFTILNFFFIQQLYVSNGFVLLEVTYDDLVGTFCLEHKNKNLDIGIVLKTRQTNHSQCPNFYFHVLGKTDWKEKSAPLLFFL